MLELTTQNFQHEGPTLAYFYSLGGCAPGKMLALVVQLQGYILAGLRLHLASSSP